MLAEQRYQQNIDSLLAVLHLQLNAECGGTSVKVRWTSPTTKKLYNLTGTVKSTVISKLNQTSPLSYLIEITCPESGNSRTVSRTCEELYE